MVHPIRLNNAVCVTKQEVEIKAKNKQYEVDYWDDEEWISAVINTPPPVIIKSFRKATKETHEGPDDES